MSIFTKDIALIIENFERRGHIITEAEAEEIWSSYSTERLGEIWTEVETVNQEDWNEWVLPIFKKTYVFQIIQVGNLYYSGMKQGEKDVRFYFSEKEDLGFPIFIEDIAEKLTEKFGGKILRKNVSLPEYVRLQEGLHIYNQIEGNRILNILVKEELTL